MRTQTILLLQSSAFWDPQTSSLMVLVRLLLTALSAASFWISYTPPPTVSPPAKVDQKKLGGMEMSFGRFVPFLAKACKVRNNTFRFQICAVLTFGSAD